MSNRTYFWRRIAAQLACTVAVAIVLTTASYGQLSSAKPKPAQSQEFEFSPGIKAGESLPQIDLSNQSGEPTSVQKLLQKAPVAIVLFRSADW